MTIATVATLSLDVFGEPQDEGTICSSISTLKATLSGYQRPTEETDKLPLPSKATSAPNTIFPLSTRSPSIPPFRRAGIEDQAISTFWPRAGGDDASTYHMRTTWQPFAAITPSLTDHRHERWGSHGHFPVSGSSFDSPHVYPASTSSSTTSSGSGSSSFYSLRPGVQPQLYPSWGYPETAAQPQDWTAAVLDEGLDSRPKAPASSN